MNARSLLYVLHITILCIVYFSAAKLGLSLDAVSGFATAVWPPTGIALVVLFRFGYRLWPGIVLGAFLANASAADGHPYLVKDVRLRGLLKNAERLSIYSLIAAPILSKGKILGVLASSITNPSRRFTETDLRLATALADRAALAIENSRLYEQEQALRHTMEELNRQLADSLE